MFSVAGGRIATGGNSRAPFSAEDLWNTIFLAAIQNNVSLLGRQINLGQEFQMASVVNFFPCDTKFAPATLIGVSTVTSSLAQITGTHVWHDFPSHWPTRFRDLRAAFSPAIFVSLVCALLFLFSTLGVQTHTPIPLFAMLSSPYRSLYTIDLAPLCNQDEQLDVQDVDG